MFRSKFFIAIPLVLFVLGIATIDYVAADEKQKIKSHGVSYAVKWEQIEVGDEEGHVVGIAETRAVYISEITGERSADRGINSMDINPKAGVAFGRGYGVNTDKDGDKMIRTWEGKAVAQGQWKGTWTITKGTGKFEGVKGGGTWTSYSMGPQQSYIEVEGEMETP